MLHDLRYATRMLRRSPGFTAAAVLSLALGIGANTAIFSLIDRALLKALPVEDPGRLVLFTRITPQGEGESFDYPQFLQFRDRNRVFSDVFGFAHRVVKVRIGPQPEEAHAQLASSRYFAALGLRPAAGRFSSESEEDGAVISYRYWQRRFAMDPAAIGASITVNGVPVRILGVAAAGFAGVSLDYAADLWLPLELEPRLEPGTPWLSATSPNWVMIMARLKPGVSRQQALAEANVIFQQHLASLHVPALLSQRVELTPGGKPVFGLRKATSTPLLMLMVIVALVLLIACANIANLLLARSAARQREISVRMAVGAGRLRLIRQLLTESILLGLLGGAAGILFAMWGSDVLMSLTFTAAGLSVPASLIFRPDVRVLGFTALVSVLSGILFGLAPALRTTGSSLAAGGHRLRIYKILVASQVAVSLLLLIVAGLFVRSFQKLTDVELGFDPANVVQLWVSAPPGNYTQAQFASVSNRLLEEIQATPGVVSASMSIPSLFSRSSYRCGGFSVDSGPILTDSMAYAVTASAGFFRTMRIPLLRGRDFDRQDHAGAPRVAVINQATARRYFPNADPLGKRFGRLCGHDQVEIVGIVKDSKYDSLLSEAPPTIFLPLAQMKFADYSRVFEVRTAGDPDRMLADLRRRVAAIDNAGIRFAGKLTDLIDQSLLVQHLVARLTGFFGMLGLMLACIGVYGVLSYAVVRRTGEMGIRMALGAEPRDIRRLVLREALVPVLAGLATGLAAALAGARLVANQLFGVTAGDPLAIALATLLMAAVAAVTSYLPARRAARVDPMAALRYE